MTVTSGVLMEHLVVHHVGNKLQEEGVNLSAAELELRDPLIHDLLLQYFVSPFKHQEYFQLFTEGGELKENVVYAAAAAIFENPDRFFEETITLTNHLYATSEHPKSKEGEFYCTYFKDCLLEDELVDAVGLFKSETKEKFLKVFPSGNDFELEAHEGINIGKLDKGCLIYNTDKNKGFRVCLVDSAGKTDGQYWKDQFLKVKTRNDSYHYTENYMTLCKDFVTEKMPEEFEVSRTDQIDLLNRSADFFKKNDSFDFNDFTRQVIQQPELISSFKDYKKQYGEEKDIAIVDEFSISDHAVKKQSKVFKSVLKLDKNFHIYIHGNKEMIEKGYDEDKGMQFYKVYYKEEN